MSTAIQAIVRSIDFLVAHHKEAPDLKHLALTAGIDASQFQEMFITYTGFSPQQLQRFIKKIEIKRFENEEPLKVIEAAEE